MKSTTGTPASESICPSVLYSVLCGSEGTRTWPDSCRKRRHLRNRSTVRTPATARQAVPLLALVPIGDGFVPDLIGKMCLIRQPHRSRIVTRGNLKDVALAVIVVRDHVRHVHAAYRRFGQVLGLSSWQPQLQCSLDEPLRQCPSSEAVGGKLLAGQ